MNNIEILQEITEIIKITNKRCLFFSSTGFIYSKIVNENEKFNGSFIKNGKEYFTKDIFTNSYTLKKWFKIRDKYCEKYKIRPYIFNNFKAYHLTNL